MEEGEAEGLPAQDDGETSEWWFYVAGGRMMGPFTPYQMKQSYNAGLIGHQTRVRWLPVCYGKPALVDNSDPENTSALQEICGDGMPPFMDARADEMRPLPPKTARGRAVVDKPKPVEERAHNGMTPEMLVQELRENPPQHCAACHY